MVQLPKIDIDPYVDLALRRKWWIIVPVVLALLGGVVYVKITPKTYEASTLILVEPQRVPTSYVRPTVTVSVQSRLRTISQQVNSRTNLERIIKDFNLYPDSRIREKSFFQRIKEKILVKLGRKIPEDEANPKVSMLGLVENLRKRIKVTVRGGGNAFEISFQWDDPETAAAVANAIASQYIEQNLKVREEMAMGTTAFLRSETERLRKELEIREKEVERFKKEHMGMLPDQLQSNLNILGQLKDELTDLEKRISLEKQQALMLQAQAQAFQQGPDVGSFMVGAEGAVGEADMEIQQLQQKMEELLTRYTERHPDVVALKRRIEKLKKEAGQSQAPPETSLDMGVLGGQDMMAMQLEQINARIADYEKQAEALKKQIALYKERVERTPQVELELTKLIRDYQTVQKRYANLLAKQLDAQMAEELEKRQKGEQFRVLDPAIPPEKPIKPDVRKVFLMALVLGLGLGGGLAYVRETLDPKFYSPEEVEAFAKTKVVVSLPLLKEDGEETPESRVGWTRWMRRKAS